MAATAAGRQAALHPAHWPIGERDAPATMPALRPGCCRLQAPHRDPRDATGVKVHFLAQPFADGSDLRDFLAAAAGDDNLANLDAVVAWAKRSGLSRLREELEVIRSRPGQTRLIVGIDEGGATRQGLVLARELFDSVHV